MSKQSYFRDDAMKSEVLLISGGASGIGFGICRVLGLHGCKVAMCGRRKEKLEEACASLKQMGIDAMGFQSDVRDPKKCIEFAKAAYDKFGKITVLVNCAAGNFSVPAEKLTPNGFKTVMDIDLHGSFNMSKAALPYLKECGHGLIVNISATLHYKAFPFQLHASAAKSAIDVMTNNLGVEWGSDYNIRSVSVAPGPIEGTVGGPGGRVFGAMIRKGTNSSIPPEKFLVPLGRYGTVDDIGNTVLFLATAGDYINATTIVVDGGNWHEASGRYLMAKQIIQQNSEREKATHKGGVEKPSSKL